MGTNQIGRYAVHIHHLIGPESRVGTEDSQFSFVGNAVNNSLKWPMAIHDAHYGSIKDNVVYSGFGFGIGTEDGSESHNTFEGNFVAGIRGTMGRGKEREGREGDGFWFAGPNNIVRDNVAADVTKAGYNIYGGDNASAFDRLIPAYRGADKLVAGQGITVPMASIAVPAFADNEVYSALMGIETWFLGYDNYYHPFQGTPESVIQDFLAWHTHRSVFFGNQQNHLTIDNLVAYGDPRFIHVHGFSKGIVLLQSKEVKIRNATIENYRQGIVVVGYLDELGSNRPLEEIAPFSIEGGHLENFDNVVIGSPVVDQRTIPPRLVVIRDVDFALLRGTSLEGRQLSDDTLARPRNIVMSLKTDRGNLIQTSATFVYGYGPNRDQNLQVFLNEQAADYVVPVSATTAETGHTPGIVGAPVAGLTNALSWTFFGIAVAGEVAPSSAFTLPEIHGLVTPIGTASEGDINGDSLVNIVDLAILQVNFGRFAGATRADGDLDGDGAVSRSDVRRFSASYGRPPLAAPSSVISSPADVRDNVADGDSTATLPNSQAKNPPAAVDFIIDAREREALRGQRSRVDRRPMRWDGDADVDLQV